MRTYDIEDFLSQKIKEEIGKSEQSALGLTQKLKKLEASAGWLVVKDSLIHVHDQLVEQMKIADREQLDDIRHKMLLIDFLKDLPSALIHACGVSQKEKEDEGDEYGFIEQE